MTYELANALKDAGFPQDLHDERLPHLRYPAMEKQISLYFPTLAELIEACKPHFRKLEMGKSGTNWRADCFPNKDAQGHGHSPEEAAAKLWLALNKTK
jgi:hypothetical protein